LGVDVVVGSGVGIGGVRGGVGGRENEVGAITRPSEKDRTVFQ
jgi:hypothetical protein